MTKPDNPRLAIAFSNAGHIITHVTIILYATAVLHLPTVFHLSYGELLKLSSPGLVLYGLAALPAGWLGDRWSKLGMMVVFFFGVGVGAILTGRAESPTDLLVGLTCLGLFASIYHPVGIAWLVACASKQGMTLGLNGMFGAAGSAIAPVFVGVMIDTASWRVAFIVPGILSILVGVVLIVAATSGRVSDATQDRDPSATSETGSFWQVFIILTMTVACGGFVYTGLTTTAPKLFESGLDGLMGASYTAIGVVTGAVMALSSLGSIVGGWIADRYSARTTYLVFWVLSIAPLALVTSVSGNLLVGLMALALTFNVSFAAAENMLVARYSPFEWRSLAYGLRFVLALGVGGITVQLAGGLYDATGDFSTLYFLFAACAVIAAAGAWMLPEKKLTLQTSG